MRLGPLLRLRKAWVHVILTGQLGGPIFVEELPQFHLFLLELAELLQHELWILSGRHLQLAKKGALLLRQR